MAAETTTTISLQARDWEHIIGLLQSNTDTGVRRLLTNLQAAYNIATPPQGATVVPITTKERVLVKIYAAFNDFMNYPLYVGSNNLNRISTAIKAANVDGYITTETTKIDTDSLAMRDNRSILIRKEGRAIILIDVMDNN